MTILIMFGLLATKFGLNENKCFEGNNGDRIWLVDDRTYSDNDDVLKLPETAQETPLPVLFHSSNPGCHLGQLNWLKKIGNYKPCEVGQFSHYGEPYETIRSWVNAPPERSIVSAFAVKYHNVVNLSLLDELAAWNQLALMGDEGAIGKRTEVRNRVSVSFGRNLNLNKMDFEVWLPELERKAREFC